MNFSVEILYWYWLIAAVILIVLEMVIPAAYFLWMGAASLVLGLLTFFMPEMIWLVQVVIFLLLSIVSLLIYKKYETKHETDVPHLNRRGAQYIGHVFTLEESIINGVGKVKIGDTLWRVSGSDQAAGSNVKVINTDGVILLVEKE